MITQGELKEILNYNEHTGIFTWKINGTRIKIGMIAGSKNNKEYIKVMINKKQYSAHRLAWFYVFGKWPDNEIDHKNGIKYDNRIENLREATHFQNSGNRIKCQSDNKTGFLGVYYRPEIEKYVASIKVNKKPIHIGYFKTAEEAHKAYINKKRELHEFCTI